MIWIMFKLGICTEKRRRRLSGPNHFSEVIDGVNFVDGAEVSNPTKSPLDQNSCILFLAITHEHSVPGRLT